VTQHQQGIYFAGEVASFATGLIVGSQFSRDLIEIECRRSVPITVLPLASIPPGEMVAEGWAGLARKYNLDPVKSIPVSSIGITWPTKLPEVLIEGFSEIGRRNDHALLAFVGPYDERYRRKLQDAAAAVGIRDKVLFTGYVSENELETWLAASRCVVQLRYPTNGESSHAVMRAMAAGAPTILNDHGSARELPDDAVLKVSAQPSPEEVRTALEVLLSDEALRNRLSEGARRYAESVSFENVVDRFWNEVILAS
jgi:glycosyltransferase involved in cell wall biosynthesis